MALKSNSKIFSCILLAFVLFTHTSADEEVVCEKLNEETCAFAVSAKGKRCVLERSAMKRGVFEAYACRATEVEADKARNIIESDRSVSACGLERKTLGISSDSLLDPRFTRKLCSPPCYTKCPNIVDLYFNLAAGEGVFLPKVCEAQEKKPMREMSETETPGIISGPLGTAEPPIGAISLAPAPTPQMMLAPEPAYPSPGRFPFYF